MTGQLIMLRELVVNQLIAEMQNLPTTEIVLKIP